MTPLRIVATLGGAIADRSKRLMLDSLCMAAVAARDGLDPLPPWHTGPTKLDIPIARSECGRVYLCSQGLSADDVHELRYKNRRFPIEEAQLLGDAKLKRINLTGGPCRSYRIPMDTVHLRGDQIEWYALGEAAELEALLVGWVGYLGHRRAVGLGKVLQWEVQPCEAWPGFPVVRGGQPLRPLPPDWAGLDDGVEMAMGNVLPPYWRRAEEELCAVPAWT